MQFPPRSVVARMACVLATVGAITAPLPADAGRAQAGGTLGIYSDWDLSGISIAGGAWDNGVQTQSVLVTSDPPTSGNVAANLNGQSGVSNARVEIAGQALLVQPGSAGLPVNGTRRFEADLNTGELKLAMNNGYTTYPVLGAGGQVLGQRHAWIVGFGYAELRESFELRFPKALAGSVVATISMRVDGLVSNSADNGLVSGVNALLEFGNIETGGITNLIAEERFHEASVAGDTITLSGSLRDVSCPTARDWCDSWITFFAALQLKTRDLATSAIQFGSGAASELDFGHTAQLTLATTPGVTLLQIDTLEPIAYAWVNPSPVSEPGEALLMLSGLGALLPRVRRRWAKIASAP